VRVDAGSSLPRVLDGLPRNRTVCLHRGVHEWSGGLSLRAPRTTIRNYPGERATMRGLVRIEVSATGSVIKNLTLDGRSDRLFLSPLIYADRAVLRNNEITNGNTGICVHIDSYNDHPPPQGVVIHANRIHDCGALPPSNVDHGIYVGDAVGTIIRGNWIYDNADRGIQLYPNADGTSVTGNVIEGNGQGILFGGSGGQTADNNLVAHNVISGSIVRHNVEDSWEGSVGTGNVVRDNCVWTTTLDPNYSGKPAQSGIVGGARGFTAFNNTVANPGYVAAARHNFSLRPSSRCAAVVHDAPGVPGP
jgi:parallel beta-helix repeat protein